MRILIQDIGTVSDGVACVLQAVNHNVTIWEPALKPAFDAFDETEPELFLGNYSRAVEKCIKERKPFLRTGSLAHMSYAANTFRFHKGIWRPELACDIMCVGEIDQSTFNCLVAPLLDLKTKIVGSHRWQAPQYLGPISTSTLCDLYASAKVSLVLRPYESIYQILASGGMPISLPPTPIEFDEMSLCQAHTLSGFEEIVRELIREDMAKTREKYVERGREVIYRMGTYWHRTANMFKQEWGLDDEAERIMQKYHETVRI